MTLIPGVSRLPGTRAILSVLPSPGSGQLTGELHCGASLVQPWALRHRVPVQDGLSDPRWSFVTLTQAHPQPPEAGGQERHGDSIQQAQSCSRDLAGRLQGCGDGAAPPVPGASSPALRLPNSGADDLLPILSFVALRSGLPQLVSECAALEEFIHERWEPRASVGAELVLPPMHGAHGPSPCPSPSTLPRGARGPSHEQRLPGEWAVPQPSALTARGPSASRFRPARAGAPSRMSGSPCIPPVTDACATAVQVPDRRGGLLPDVTAERPELRGAAAPAGPGQVAEDRLAKDWPRGTCMGRWAGRGGALAPA